MGGGDAWALTCPSTSPFTVNDPGDTTDGTCDALHCTAREAVDCADATPGTDTILIDVATVTLEGGVDDTNVGGDLDVYDDLIVKPAGSSHVSLYCAGESTGDRCWHTHAGANLTIQRVDMMGGDAAASGGCIYAVDYLQLDDLTVSSCTATPGTGGGGGAVYVGGQFRTSGTVVVAYNELVGDRGGGVYVVGDYEGEDLRLMYNAATGSTADGGGIYSEDDVVLEGLYANGNSAGRDGGAWFADGDYSSPSFVRVATGVFLSGNDAGNDGGGAFAAGAVGAFELNGTFGMNVIGNNDAGEDGGGLAIHAAAPMLTELVIASNFADNRGGGVYSTSADLVLEDVILSSNRLPWGAGGTHGAGMFLNANSSVTLLGGEVYANEAPLNGGGIAMNNVHQVILEDVDFEANLGKFGGGMYVDAEILEVDVASFELNEASGNGGAIYVADCGSSTAPCLLWNTTIDDNAAVTYGGGIYVKSTAGGRLELLHVTLSDNVVGTTDDAIDNHSTSFTLAAEASATNGPCAGPITDLGYNAR